MVVTKNGWGLLGCGTLTSAVSQEGIYELVWFFTCWFKFTKAKSYFDNYWVDMVKNGQGLIDHGILKPGVSHTWFDELSRLIEWFLYAGSDGINFYCVSLTPRCWGTTAVVLSQSFLGKFPLCKNDLKWDLGFTTIWDWQQDLEFPWLNYLLQGTFSH